MKARDLRAARAVPGISRRDRMLAWLVTGPLGRFSAFVLDLGSALVASARRTQRVSAGRQGSDGERSDGATDDLGHRST